MVADHLGESVSEHWYPVCWLTGLVTGKESSLISLVFFF